MIGRLFLVQVGIVCLGLQASVSSLAAAPKVMDASRDGIQIIARLDASSVTLSGTLNLHIEILGPAPVRPTFPTPTGEMLHPDVQAIWELRASGPPKIESRPNQQELWKQSFIVSAFPPAVGEAIPFALAPFKLTVGTAPERTITWPESTFIEVTSSVSAQSPQLRPITDLERFPIDSTPKTPATVSSWPLWLLGLLLLGISMVVLRWRLRRRWVAEPIFNAAAVVQTIEQLQAARLAPEAELIELGLILRRYLASCHGIHAGPMTSIELWQALTTLELVRDDDQWLVGEFLNALDRRRYAEAIVDPMDRADCQRYAAWLVRWVQAIEKNPLPRDGKTAGTLPSG